MSRFAIREATTADAEGIARVHVASWQTSYRGILPEDVLDRIDVGQRFESRKRMLLDHSTFHLVAYDVTHHDVLGFCDAGPARRQGPDVGEIYAIYLLHRAKRYGLGSEMIERTVRWLSAAGMRSMIIWVLENNHHARRFYEAMGGKPSATLRTTVAGFPVVELSYLWDRI
jgi:GNAT superfamily N-acetyltransferase